MFSLDGALAYARRLPRYSYRSLIQPQRLGPFVPQLMIPIASRAQTRRSIRVTRPKNSKGSVIFTNPDLRIKTVWIVLADIKSEQMCLRRSKLMYQLRHYAEMQRKHRPFIVMARGVYTIWDGNHRITAGRLLGKKRMRCMLLYDPAECARTLKYIERGGLK